MYLYIYMSVSLFNILAFPYFCLHFAFGFVYCTCTYMHGFVYYTLFCIKILRACLQTYIQTHILIYKRA